MKRSLLLGILTYALILLGLATLNGPIVALALPLIIYLGAALLYGPQDLCLKVSRTLSEERISTGMPIVVTLTVTNEGAKLEELLLEDFPPEQLELIEGSTRLLTSLPRGETVELTYTLEGKRGMFYFSDVRVTAYDRLGLFRRETVVEAPGQLLIMPQRSKLRRVVIRPQRTRVYSGIVPARRGGPGIEFFGVREYQLGDALRWVNWRISARHPGTLFTNEFEQERAADVGLILDTRRRSYRLADNEMLFEHAVQATATLAETFLTDGNRVGLLRYGDILSWTFPGYGKVQRERILQSLARSKLGESLYFDQLANLPTRLFPTHSQIVLISPLVQDDLSMLVLLRARGYQLLVISPDPITFEEKLLGQQPSVRMGARIARLERTLLLRKLRLAGVQILNWITDVPFEAAVHAALGRQPLWFRAVGVEP